LLKYYQHDQVGVELLVGKVMVEVLVGKVMVKRALARPKVGLHHHLPHHGE
jgi:hypothetical protein